MDLELEFNKLMQEVLDKIKAKNTSGEYSPWEANDLSDKVLSVMDHGSTSNYDSCPEGHTDPDCGWSPSMGYHCS
jgi:hypothetical protein